jgi:hypothetical protein
MRPLFRRITGVTIFFFAVAAGAARMVSDGSSIRASPIRSALPSMVAATEVSPRWPE